MKYQLCFLFLFSSSVLLAQKNFIFFYNNATEKYNNKNFVGAEADYGSAIKNKESAKNEYQIANAYNGRALCKMKLKNYQDAMKDVSEAIEIKPEYSELYYTGGLINLEMKKYPECKKWTDKGLALKPNNEDLLLLKAKANFESYNYADATDLISVLLEKINPKNIEALMLKGEINERQRKFPEGIADFSSVIELDAQFAGAFFNRGICYAQNQEFELAKQDMLRGMEIDSNQKWVGLNNIAFFISFKNKDYEGAINLLNEAIRLQPKMAYAYNNRGYAKMKLNDLKGAWEDIKKSIELDKENAYAYKTYAELLLAEKKNKQACEKLEMALELGYTEKFDNEVKELISNHCK